MRRRTKTDLRIAQHEALAMSAGLDCPRGRAVVLESNIQNRGGFWARTRVYATGSQDPQEWALDFMRSVRLDTAQRWLEHYDSGGDVRVLTRSRAEHAEFRRTQRSRRK